MTEPEYIITEEELNMALDDMFEFCKSGTLKRVRSRRVSSVAGEAEKVLDAFGEIINRLEMADGEGESDTGQPLIRLGQAMKIVDDVKAELHQQKERH